MSESELRAIIRGEIRKLQVVDLGDEPLDAAIERIMDAVADYAREEAGEAASYAIRDYEERM